MKTIIMTSGLENRGKTESTVEIFNILNNKGQFEVLEDDENGDIKAIGIYNGKKIGVESVGDPGSRQADSVRDFVKANCQIIICCSRTKGQTVEAIEDIAKQNSYIIICTSNYYCQSGKKLPNNLDLNKQYANSIIDLVDRL